MTDPRNANGSRRRKLRARVAAMGKPCWICEYQIDYSEPAGNPTSYELDELRPVSKGGDPLDIANTDATHRCCNNWKSSRTVAEVQRVKALVLEVYGGWLSPLDFVEKARSVRGKARKLKTVKHSREW